MQTSGRNAQGERGVKLQALENGIWHGSFEDAAGNLRVISLRTGDRTTAEAIASALVELSASSTGSETPSVEKVFRDWATEKKCEIGSATADFYKQTLNGFLRFLGPRASADISTVGRDDIIAYRARFSKTLSAKTVNHRLKTLRMVLEFAVRQRWLWENPARHIKAVRNNEPRVRRGFTIEEVRKLLEIATPEWRTMIKLGLYTGQRLGDLARLTWQNVDLEKQTIELTTRKTVKHLEIPIAAPLLNHLQNIKKPSATREMAVCPEAFKMIQSCHGRTGTIFATDLASFCQRNAALGQMCPMISSSDTAETAAGDVMTCPFIPLDILP